MAQEFQVTKTVQEILKKEVPEEFAIEWKHQKRRKLLSTTSYN
jgi:hypothetical protein